MKKIVAIILVIAMSLSFAFSVFADSEAEKARLIKALENFQIKLDNGNIITLKQTDINAAKNFLSSYKSEITPGMVNAIIAKLNEVAIIVKNSDSDIKSISDIGKLSKSEREAILKKSNEAAGLLDIQVNLNNQNGKVEFVDSNTGAPKYESSAVIKKTGPSTNVSSVYFVLGFVALSVIGCAVLTKKFTLTK